MINRTIHSVVLVAVLVWVAACYPNPQPAGLTPIPTLAPNPSPTLIEAVQGLSLAEPTAVPGQGAGPTATPVPPDPAAGAAVFIKNCSACHGNQGEGISAPALRNNDFIHNNPDATVVQVVENGLPGGMPAWLVTNGGALSETQIKNAVAYLKTLQGVAQLPKATPAPTDTPAPANAPAPEPAKPSNPGGPGNAVNLQGDAAKGKLAFGNYCAACHGPEGMQGAPNPDSDDGEVPALNPIDETIKNKDPKVFATNVDLFIEHGSIPSGPAPQLAMPSFGDSKLLTPQQIADLIAFVMSVNQ